MYKRHTNRNIKMFRKYNQSSQSFYHLVQKAIRVNSKKLTSQHKHTKSRTTMTATHYNLFSVSSITELGSRCDKDVLIGSTLVQVEGVLFFQDQQPEESSCSLRTSSSFTERLQAEPGVTVALNTHTQTHVHTNNREFNLAASSLILLRPPLL